MARGFVYVLTNTGMPSLIKVGFSTRAPEERASELSTTGVPFPFKVAFSAEVDDPSQVEAEVHAQLSEHRASENREFFRLSVEQAIAVIENICGTGGNPILSDGDLSPWSNIANWSYHDHSSKYYPRAVRFSVEQPDVSQTWFPDDDIARTRKGKVKCPHCGQVFEQSVSALTPYLPPLSVQCQACRRTILMS